MGGNLCTCELLYSLIARMEVCVLLLDTSQAIYTLLPQPFVACIAFIYLIFVLYTLFPALYIVCVRVIFAIPYS